MASVNALSRQGLLSPVRAFDAPTIKTPPAAPTQVDQLLRGAEAVRVGAYATPAKGTVNVLTIDGGGVYAIRAARIIAEIERRAGKIKGRASIPISELVTVIGGTSAGAMLAASLTRPNPLSAEQAVDLCLKRSQQIFKRDIWYQARSFNGLFGNPRYPSEGLDAVLKDVFGDTKMSEARIDLLITGYEQDLGPMAVTSWPVGPGGQDHLMREAARGSAAVPAFFTPGQLGTIGGDGKPLRVLDGGLWATNPTLVTTQAAKHRYPEATRFNIISLGLGKDHSSDVGDASSKWGLFQWTPFMLATAFLTPERMAEAQIAEYLHKGDFYMRLSPPVMSRARDSIRGVGAFDDGSEENMALHIAQVEAWIAAHSDVIDMIVAVLTAPEAPIAEKDERPKRRAATNGIYKPLTTRIFTLAPRPDVTTIDLSETA